MDSIEISPLTGVFGAEVAGIDLAAVAGAAEGSPEAAKVAALREALWEHHVVVLRDQKLSREEQLRFARHFGEPEVHPIANGMGEHPEIIRVLKPAGESASFGTGWHTDNSFFERPSAVTVLYGDTVPPQGGDTLFASAEHAYQALSEPMKAFLAPLRAVHSASSAYDPAVTGEEKYRGEAAITYTYSDVIHEEVEHPVVRTHAESGRKSLFVNPMFTQRLVGLSDAESRAVLELLYEHITRPDFGCRVRWQPGTVTLWDNRSVQHYALDDYREYERVMYRVTLSGERPR